MSSDIIRGRFTNFGWLPDLPDFRDLSPDSAPIQQLLASKPVKESDLPKSVDLKQWFSPVEDQESIGSCTAQAIVGLVEYYQLRRFGEHLDASRLFLYKATRNLLGLTGDTGAYVRSTIKALRLFGVCPEQFWPYKVEDFEEEPPAFCYAFASNYQAVSYFRLDGINVSPSVLLGRIRSYLAAGHPLAFGFTVYSSIYNPKVQESGDIPFPGENDKAVGGHAVDVVGYDDDRAVLLLRNSWGTAWGDQGYGSIPYAYVENGLARDFWALLKSEWVSLD